MDDNASRLEGGGGGRAGCGGRSMTDLPGSSVHRVS